MHGEHDSFMFAYLFTFTAHSLGKMLGSVQRLYTRVVQKIGLGKNRFFRIFIDKAGFIAYQ